MCVGAFAGCERLLDVSAAGSFFSLSPGTDLRWSLSDGNLGLFGAVPGCATEILGSRRVGFRVCLDLSASSTESFVEGGVLFGSGFLSGLNSWSLAAEATAVLTGMAVASAALADAGGADGSAVVRR